MTDRRPNGGPPTDVDACGRDEPSPASAAERLAVVGASCRKAPLDVRERLTLSRGETGVLASRIAGRGEAAVLSTCGPTVRAREAAARADGELQGAVLQYVVGLGGEGA